MTPREQRLRSRIDRLTDERNQARGDLAFLTDRDDYNSRLLLTMRARLNEVRCERDEALRLLWEERDAFTRNRTDVKGAA